MHGHEKRAESIRRGPTRTRLDRDVNFYHPSTVLVCPATSVLQVLWRIFAKAYKIDILYISSMGLAMN